MGFTAVPSRVCRRSMCCPPTEEIAMAVSKALGDPSAIIRALRPVHSSRLRRVYVVVLADSRTLELVMPPPSMTRLLRSERPLLESEAVVVQWIGALLSQGSPASPGSTQEQEEGDTSPDRAGTVGMGSGGTRNQLTPAESGLRHGRSRLLRLLPKLVDQIAGSANLGAGISLYQPAAGTPIASLPRPLTEQERDDVAFQLGQVIGQYARIQSPTGRFGQAVSVLASTTPTPHSRDASRSPTPPAGGPPEGSRTWSAAFNLMFEGVLRDAEDMAIMLAYSIARKHLVRLSYVLDEVTVPSLVFIDGMEHDNVLVAYESAMEHGDTRGSPHSSGRDSSDGGEHSRGEQGGKETESAELVGSTSDDTVRKGGQPAPTGGVERKIQVVGLRDWSNGFFGDPLLATAFSNNPSKQLLDGFYGTTITGNEPPTPGSEERDATATTRLLLYQAYHATVSIVTEFYRPRSESTVRELAARRRLTEALAKLEEVEDDPKAGRHQRPSGEMSPAKKLKPDKKERASPSRAA